MRILVYRLGSLGDTVVALPCFRLIRHLHPHARITVLTNTPVSGKAAPLESVLQNTGLIDDVVHYPPGLRHPGKLLLLWSTLRAQRFDLLISLTASRGLLSSIRDYFFFKTCDISKIIGIPFARYDLIRQPLADGTGFEPEAERLLRRIGTLGSADLGDKQSYDLGLTAEENAEAKRLLAEKAISGKFIAASLGTKSPLKDWGTENWSTLLEKLSRAWPGYALVLLGSADELARSESLLASWEGSRANLCGQTSPRVSAALLREARLFVGHDSGPMHLAAAVGTRCVTIYSAQSPPGQWFPFGKGHINLYPFAFFDPQRTTDPGHQRQAISSIRVDDVLAAVRRCLD